MPRKPEPPAELASSTGELIVYADDDGGVRVHVRLVDGTVWLTQRLMAELFGKDVRTINEHLTNIFEDDELDPAATIRKFRIVRTEGNRRVSRLIDHYALPAILAVGYRVRSAQGTRFRQWATARLDEYLVKGFVLDDERLASGRGRAKNYLDEDELQELNRSVTMHLDYAEDQARNRRAMTMAQWVEKLDAFLAFNEREVLVGGSSSSLEPSTSSPEWQSEIARRLQKIEDGQASFHDAEKHLQSLRAEYAPSSSG